MKRIVATILAVMIVFSIFGAVTASADIGYGNVNQKDGVTVDDALMVLQASVKMIELDDTQKNLARVSGGTDVTVTDAMLILQYAVGKINEFKMSAPEVNDTILDNGAYTLDETADNSFVVDISNLNREMVYVLSTRNGGVANMSAEEVRLVASLQGLINRSYGMDNEHTTMFMLSNDQSDGFWLKQMRNGGATSILKKTKQLANMDAFYETFKEQLKSCGMVLWDPDVPATANVAVTVCGTDGYLPVMKSLPLSALKLSLTFATSSPALREPKSPTPML